MRRTGRAVRRAVRQSALAVGLTFAATTVAEAACGDFYRVQRGDTLRVISVQQLKTEDYKPLFEANRDILRDPALIEVGQLLYLPCPGAERMNRKAAMAAAGMRPTPRDDLGDRLARTAAPREDDAAEKPVETADADATAPVITGTRLRVLTGSGLAPLAGRDLPGDGLANLILSDALVAAGDPRTVEFAFVDDWKAHLPVLMPTGAFNIGVPWPRPDCKATDRSALVEKLCADFVFSEPLYEMPVATVVQVGSPFGHARSMSEMAGRTICRPSGFPPVDLEKLRTSLNVVTADSAEDCAAMLISGKADAISLPEPMAARLLADAAYTGRLVRAQYLGASVPVHALAWNGDPAAKDVIRQIDAGLAAMKASGRWLEVVTAYLRDLDKAAPSQ